MATDLTGLKVKDTYNSLLKIGDNSSLSATPDKISDGFGNESILYLSTSQVSIGALPATGYDLTVGNSGIKTQIIDVVGAATAASLQLTGGSGSQGTLSWNTDEETVDIIQNGAVLQLGQETHVHVKNQTGSTITDGTPVYVTGTLGSSGRLTVAPMIADGTIEAKYFLGITTEDIPNGEDGKVTTFGKIRGLDTTAYSEGQTLYVSASTAGAFQTTAPVAPNLDLEVAIVINVSANNGTIFVRAQNGHYLGLLHDVYLNSPANNQFLVYNSTNSRWENQSISSVGSINLDTVTDNGNTTDNDITVGDITAGNVTLSGYLRGAANFVIDPAAYGDETGVVQILGDLRVDGTTTTINSTTVTIDDKNLVLASGSATAADADGAGITIDGANATMTYNSTSDRLDFNKDVETGRLIIKRSDATLTALSLNNTAATNSYTLQEWRTDTLGATEAYIIAYGSQNNDDGSFAIKNTANHETTNGTSGDIWFQNRSSETLRLYADNTSRFFGDVTGTKFIGNIQTNSIYGSNAIDINSDTEINIQYNGSTQLRIDQFGVAYLGTVTFANDGISLTDEDSTTDSFFHANIDYDAGLYTITSNARYGADYIQVDGLDSREQRVFAISPKDIGSPDEDAKLYLGGNNSITAPNTLMDWHTIEMNALSVQINGNEVATRNWATLQTVTDNGATSTNDIYLENADLYLDSSSINGTGGRRVRFTEDTSSAGYQGAYIYYNGDSNLFQLGVHDANDENVANDVYSIQIARSTGNVEVNNSLTAGSFVKRSGTSSQFLKADGSVDSNVYLTTESDTLQTVTNRGNSTNNSINITGGSPLNIYNGTETDRRLTINQSSGEFPRIYNFDEVNATFHEIVIGGGNNETSGILVDGAGDVDVFGALNVDGSITVNNTIHTPDGQNLYIRPGGNGNVYFGNAGNGNRIYHYSSYDDGVYTIFDHTTTTTRFNTTASDGFYFEKGITVSGENVFGKEISSAAPIRLTNANLYVYDTSTTLTAGMGGGIAFSGSYTSTGSKLGTSPYIRASKKNANDGDYGYGLDFGVRATGSANSNIALQISSDSDLNISSGDLKMGGSLVIDSSRNITAGTGSFSNLYASGQFSQGVTIANKIFNYGSEFRASGASIQIVFGRDTNNIGSGAIGADSINCFAVWNTDTVTTKMVISQAGKMGIAQSSPQADIHIGTNDGNRKIILSGANSDNISSEIIFGDNNDSSINYAGMGIRYDSANNNLSFRSFFDSANPTVNRNAEIIRIDRQTLKTTFFADVDISSGNLEIGGSTAINSSRQLDVTAATVKGLLNLTTVGAELQVGGVEVIDASRNITANSLTTDSITGGTIDINGTTAINLQYNGSTQLRIDSTGVDYLGTVSFSNDGISLTDEDSTIDSFFHANVDYDAGLYTVTSNARYGSDYIQVDGLDSRDDVKFTISPKDIGDPDPHAYLYIGGDNSITAPNTLVDWHTIEMNALSVQINGNEVATQSWVNTNTLNQTEGDLRYLQLSGGTLTGALNVTGTRITYGVNDFIEGDYTDYQNGLFISSGQDVAIQINSNDAGDDNFYVLNGSTEDILFRIYGTSGAGYFGGNFGIGRVPSYKLEVAGSVALNVMEGFQQEGTIRIGRSDGTDRYHEINAYNDNVGSNNYLNFRVHNGTVDSLATVLTLKGDGSSFFAGDVSIGTNDFTAGTATIGGILLQDSSDRGGVLEINRKGTNSWTGTQIKHDTALWSVMGNATNFGIYDDVNSDWILLHDTLGSTSLFYQASEKLEVESAGVTVRGRLYATDYLSVGDSGNGASYIYLLSSTTGLSQLRMGDTDTDAGAIAYSNATDTMTIRTGAANNVSIDSSGNVAIPNGNLAVGTAATTHKLEVVGNTYLNGKIGIGITPATTWDLRIKGQYPLGLQDSAGIATFEFYADLKENRYLNGAKIVGYGQDLVLDTSDSTRDIILGTTATSVGIGTTSPNNAYKLDVAGYGLFDNAVVIDGTDTGNPVASSNDQIRVSGYGILGNRGTFYVTNAGGEIQIGNGSNHNADPTAVFGSTRVNLLKNVGIATNNPAARLEITTATGQEGIIINNSAAVRTFELGHLTSNNSYFQMRNTSEVTEVLFRTDGGDSYINTGDIGFGSTTPTSRIHVAGDAYVSGQIGQGVLVANKILGYGAEFRSSGASIQIAFGRSDNAIGSGAIGADSTNCFAVWTTDTIAKKMVISQGGNMGIGVDTPNRKLSVGGAIELTTADTTIHTAHAAIRRGSAGEMFLDAPGDITVTIDTNNNNTDRVFNVRKDTGAELFRIQEDGHCGLGTSTPGHLLHLSQGAGSAFIKAIKISGQVSTGGGQSIFFKTSGNDADDRYGVKLGALRSGLNNGSSEFIIQMETSNMIGMEEVFRIAEDKNVGIGVSNPTVRLAVDGTINGDNIISSAAFTTASNRFKLVLTKQDSGTIEAAIDDVVLSNQLDSGFVPYTTTAGGNGDTTNAILSDSFLKINSSTLELDWGDTVGVYTERNLKMRKDGGGFGQYYESDYQAGKITFNHYDGSTTDTATIESTSAGDLILQNAGNEVGIGKTPSYTLDVDGTARFEDYVGINVNPETTVGLKIQSSGAGGSRCIKMTAAQYGSVGYMEFPQNSSGITVNNAGTSSQNAFGFLYGSTSVGNIKINSTTTSYNTTSDYRLKENITEITDGIDRLKQLKPSRFNFIGYEEVVDGFIAHEAQAVVPEAVSGEKDAVDYEGNPDYQGIDQSKLVPLLTAALQEAVAKIESLEQRILNLENK